MMPSAESSAPNQPRRLLLMGGVGLVPLIIVVCAALMYARLTFHMPFPGLFLDPYAAFSNVSMPAWDIDGLTLKYPHQLVSINGQALPSGSSSRDVYDRIAELQRAGDRQVQLTFSLDGQEMTVDRPIRQLGADELGFFFGFYAIVALFLLWTGAVVLTLAGRRLGGRAYAAWTVAAFLLFLTFYDYHTTSRLVPWFSIAGVGFDLGFLWLAYAFPEPPRRLQRSLRAILLAITTLGVLAAVWLVAAWLLGADASKTRWVVGNGVPLSMAVLLISLVLRMIYSSGRERAELLSAAWGLAVVPAMLAVGFLVTIASGRGVIHLFVPFLIPLIPLSVGFALVRHNILETDAVLSRRLLVGPIATASLGCALLSWLVLRHLVREGVETWLPTLLSVPVLLGSMVVSYQLSSRLLFPAASQFRPTLEQLSDQLSSLHEAPAIRRAVEEVVARWLPTSGTVRVIEAPKLPEVSSLPTDGVARLTAGQHLWTQETPWQRNLLVPMRSLGKLRGVLLLPPKHQAALYTSEDLMLLATIASLGAVALHHAEALRELEKLRRAEVEVTRDEKRFAIGMLSAEISHEIAYPLNFFRYLLKRCGKGTPLDPQDVEIGSEEVARLDRMLVTLRKLKPPSPQLAPVVIIGPLKHALELIREFLEEKSISVAVEIPSDLVLQADPDMVLQLFANLLRNAAQAVEVGGQIGVRSVHRDSTLRLVVWDSGLGVPEELRDSIWNPWVTTKEDGSGLGLAITQRIVRSLNWTISLEREKECTCFCIDVPSDSLLPSA